MIGVGLRETPDAMRVFAREFGIGFPLWIDPEGNSPEAFGVWGHPSTVLIDRDGRIVGRIRGERDWSSEDARRLVEQLLTMGR
jgi:peroxiredoxin